MSNPNYRWPTLIDKYLTGQLTDIELQELNRQKAETPWKQEQFGRIATTQGFMKRAKEIDETDLDANWEEFKNEYINQNRSEQVTTSKAKDSVVWYIAAAVLAGFIALGIIWYFIQKNDPSIANLPPLIMRDLSLGKDVLFIAEDGTKIKLDSIPDGNRIASDIPYVKKDSRIMSEAVHQAAYTAKTGVYTLYVPAGKQYQLTLPDGTNIKVNAASSVYFPINYPEKYRWVGMEGEAFFEVAKNSKKPFFINIKNKMCAEVFGTTFNINSYDDSDSITTTLINGKIRIAQLDTSYRIIDLHQLLSGQQSCLKNGQLSINKDIKIAPVIAWTTGKFDFEKKTIKEIMQEISRWYSVKIRYNGVMPNRTSSGKMSRSLPLPSVIKILEVNNDIDIIAASDSVLIISPQLQSLNTSE